MDFSKIMSYLKQNKGTVQYLSILQSAVILLILYTSSFYSYLLFHSLAEVFCIAVAYGIFVVAWNSRRFIDNNYFLLIGVAYFFIGFINILHTLAFQGMGVFYGDTTNLATQLWIAARVLTSVTFLIAPLFISRKIKSTLTFNIYSIVTALLLFSIFYWKNFPVTYQVGLGLTTFRLDTEYVISAVLILSIVLLIRQKNKFDKNVFGLLIGSLGLSVVGEIIFTKYPNYDGFANLIGHFFEVGSFYLFYLCLIETGLMKPYKLLFKNLKDNETALRNSEQRYRDLVELSPETIIVHQNRLISYINPAGLRLLGATDPAEVLGRDVLDFFHEESKQLVLKRLQSLKGTGSALLAELKMRQLSGQIIDVESTAKVIENKKELSVLVMIRDVTKRKAAEQELQEKQQFIERLINATPNILYIYDLFERSFVFVNSEITNQLGYQPEQILKVGRNILQELVHPADYEKVLNHHRQMLTAKEGGIFKIEYRMKDALGNWHWLENFDTVFLKAASGVTKQIIGTAQDFTDKKQAFMELNEVKETLRLALENYPDPFVIYNAKLEYTFVNEKTARAFGRAKEAIIGRKDVELFGEETYLEYLPLLKRTIESRKKQTQECVIKFPAGEVTYVVTYVPLFNKAGVITQVIGVNYDITKSKKTELAMKDSEERYRSIVELSPDALVIHDFGKIIFINTSGLYLFGLKNKNEIIGKELKDFFHPDVKDLVAERINHVRRSTDKSPLFDSRIIAKDGRIIDVEIKGTVINYEGSPAVQTIIRDITTRKLAMDDASDHVVITDPKGVIIYANKAAERMTGYSRGEIIGKTSALWGNCVEKNLEQNIQACRSAMDMIKINNSTSFTGEVVNQRKNGEKYIADLHLSPVYELGKIIFYISIERDVTRLKEIDQAKTEFVSLASHQLRTPLTGISLSSELLLRGVAGPVEPATRPYLEEIYASSQKMKGLIDDFLNISRIELGTFPIKPEEINLPAEIDLTLDSLILQIQKNKLVLIRDYEENLPIIKFDRNILTVIIENLLTNAIRYTAAEGQITLSVKRDGEEVLIKVTDTGCGIPKDEQKKIFSKLFRSENAKEISVDGAGLGLYIVKSLIRQVNSKIWVESTVGVGTTFYVAIPLK